MVDERSPAEPSVAERLPAELPVEERSQVEPSVGEHSVGELVHRATEQLSQLVRQELTLAKLELTEKGRRMGRGGELLGAAGAIGYVGLIALAGAAIAALSLVLPVWAAALIVTGVLFAIAGVLALVGRSQLRRAARPVPEEMLGSVKADVEVIKERARHR
ncbi:phage holin family protein [Streptomyces sp. NPDC091412]|uniref:phage holin family protein n=1 Tax=Streptomyces sp. NPDC091412 TaxID=3366002 RepID=UPI00380145B9